MFRSDIDLGPRLNCCLLAVTKRINRTGNLQLWKLSNLADLSTARLFHLFLHLLVCYLFSCSLRLSRCYVTSSSNDKYKKRPLALVETSPSKACPSSTDSLSGRQTAQDILPWSSIWIIKTAGIDWEGCAEEEGLEEFDEWRRDTVWYYWGEVSSRKMTENVIYEQGTE